MLKMCFGKQSYLNYSILQLIDIRLYRLEKTKKTLVFIFPKNYL